MVTCSTGVKELRCDRCERLTYRLWRTGIRNGDREVWVCDECKEKHVPRRDGRV